MLSVMNVLSPSTTCSAHRFEKRKASIRSVWGPYTEACGWRFVVRDFPLLFCSSLDGFLLGSYRFPRNFCFSAGIDTFLDF